jgi:hypothetical protein
MEKEQLASAYPCLQGDRLTKEGAEEKKHEPIRETYDIDLAEVRGGRDYGYILSGMSRLCAHLFRVRFYAETAGKVRLLAIRASDRLRRLLKAQAHYLRGLIIR